MMASHYDRLPGQYATQRSPIVGSSRGEHYYERDRRVVYPPRPEAEYPEEGHPPARRIDRPYYPSHDYAGAPRESRAEIWRRPPPGYAPHASPPLPSAQYRYYQDTRPPHSPQWEERPRWEEPPDDRSFEPSVAWLHHRREPSHPRLNSLLNPAPASPLVNDHRWREPAPTAVDPAPPRDYGRTFTPDYHLYDDHHPTYHERPPPVDPHIFVLNDVYRHPLHERPSPRHWENPTYRPEIIPTARTNRPSAIRDYKRPRQMSVGQSPGLSEHEVPNWTRERHVESNRSSREGSLVSSVPAAPGDRERTLTGSSHFGTHRVTAGAAPLVSPTKSSRIIGDVSSDEFEFSGDESVLGQQRRAQALKQTLNDISRSREHVRENYARKEMQSSSNDPAHVVPSHPPTIAAENRPSPVIRHAWDPSTDQYVPFVADNVRIPLQSEGRTRRSNMHPSSFDHSSLESMETFRHVSQAQHGSPASRTHGSPGKNGTTAASPLKAAQGSGSNRQRVMSVHDLVSPSPVKPYTSSALSRKAPSPLLLDDVNMEDGSLHMGRPPVARGPIAPEVVETESARARLAQPEEYPYAQQNYSIASQARTGSPTGLDRRRSPSDEPSAIGFSQMATPDMWTPDPDADRTLAEVEAQIADARLSSPRPPITLQPGEKLSQDGIMRILAPRAKADEKDITEMLRRAIMLRRAFDLQSREERVNPILMDNLARSDGQEQKLPSVSGNVVAEVVDRILAQNEEEHHMSVRSLLAARFAEQTEFLAEKVQGLRNEYMRLHERWVAHCTHLDSLFKANDMQEALTQAGRTTRRSAATLGDAVRSDLEMEQIIASLGNEDLTDPNHLAVRNVAKIPDMISVVKGHVDHIFDDTNNTVDDPEGFYDPRSGFFDWTPDEEAIFYAKYAEYPKQFGIIAESLPHKTAQQCVLYYYIHKKRLIDFRNAINSGNGRRRRGGGVRRAGKQKGNALLADVAQADSRRPAGRGRRRGRGGFTDSGRGRGAGPPPSTEESVDADPRPKRRRVVVRYDVDDALSADTDNTRDTSVAPPKKRRGRKPGPKPIISADSPGASPAPGDGKTNDTSETPGPGRRKPGTTSTYWSESDREIFMRLLGRYGKDFKRISMELPNKTSVQVGNYYKNHNRELGLEKIALNAMNRVRSPEQDMFVNVSRAEAAQSRTPTEEVSAEQLVDRQVADATSGVGVLTLEQNGKPGQSVLRGAVNPRPSSSKSVINVLNPDAFQSAGSSRPRGVIISSNGQSAYTLGVSRQPAQPQIAATMTSSMINLQERPSSSSPHRSDTIQDIAEQRQVRPRSAAPTTQYTFHPQMPVTIPAGHIRPTPFMPAMANDGFNPSSMVQMSHGSGDFRPGLAVHQYSATHLGVTPPSRGQSSSQPPIENSKKPARQE